LDSAIAKLNTKEDIKSLAGVSTLDKTYANFWIDKLNLDTFGLLQ